MTGIYVRLSIENSGKDDDGDSIENQTSICKEYVESHSDLKLYDVYEDNGKKGTNFDRPEFNRLMDDVRRGKVKCLLVKDLSRFGRDYIECGEYLEKIFPFLGVRYAAVFVDAFHIDAQLLFEHVEHPVEGHLGVWLLAVEIVTYLLEYPWASEGGSPYHHGVNAIFLESPFRFLRRCDVAVADDGDVDSRVLLHFANQSPVGRTCIHLCPRPHLGAKLRP